MVMNTGDYKVQNFNVLCLVSVCFRSGRFWDTLNVPFFNIVGENNFEKKNCVTVGKTAKSQYHSIWMVIAIKISSRKTEKNEHMNKSKNTWQNVFIVPVDLKVVHRL